MRPIHNELINFRCPNVMKDRLIAYGEKYDMHISQVVREACNELLKRSNPPPALVQEINSNIVTRSWRSSE